jgi:hypothetical protein
MTIVVNTLQAQLRWAAAHVGQKSGVAVSPAVTDGDASSAVVFVVFTGRGVAAAFHVEPRLVLNCALFAISLAMALSDGAATASRSTFGQAAFVNQDALAAVAEAPEAGAVGDAGIAVGVGAVALSARWAERHDLEFAEALIDHSPLRGLNGEAVNA